ncbi:MAG TPA: ABC transporter substrate-binding protein [Candidatus Acidoferrales bacterium]|nr:ABC transporter substrate-binding protein [Candidatus Acidoferrales bacterium]
MFSTLKPGTLVVASAYPDPPFDVDASGTLTGFDVELMRALSANIGLALEPQRYLGGDFNGIFDGLAARRYDAVISGTTVTPERAARVRFSEPYLEFGQGVAVDRRRSPNVGSADDTSDAVARQLLARGIVAGVRYYPYDAIERALDDVESGAIGAVIKLAPVIATLVASRPALRVAFEVPTHERLAIAVAKENAPLCQAINDALRDFTASGGLAKLRARWIPESPGTS